jgi:hypothetical protein
VVRLKGAQESAAFGAHPSGRETNKNAGSQVINLKHTLLRAAVFTIG